MTLKHLIVCSAVVVAASLSHAAAGDALAAPADACALLSTAQVGAALGVLVNAGKSTLPGSCQWEQPGKAGASLLKLSLNFANKDRWKLAASAPQPGVTITPVSGLGDDAFYYSRGNQLTTLSVKKGDTVVVIRVWGGVRPIPETEAKEKSVAQQLLGNL